MRTFTLKGLFLTAVFMVLGCLAIHAADDDLITRQITVKLDEAGTLPDKIGSIKKYKLTNLKIVGEINGTDLCFIREMAGKNVNGNGTAGKLANLDLSEAKIVKGGDYYYYTYNSDCYTSDDVIGKYAFYYCSGLTSVTLPSSVTSIGESAFRGCSGLTSVTIPSSVTSIGKYAFRDCSNLKECNCILASDLENSLGVSHSSWQSIPVGVIKYYQNGQELTKLEIPFGVDRIGDYSFYKGVNLTSVTIPSSVTSIGSSAFSGCSGLTNLTIPSSVTSIGSSAFSGCSGLTSVAIPSSVTSIGDYVFVGCSGLTSVTIPSSVTLIGESAFRGCSGLTSVTIPSSVTSIGSYAFKNCSGLTSVTIPSSVTSIYGYAFSGCSGLTSVTSIDWYAFENCSGLTSVTIPSSVTSIGQDAFYNCSGLTSVTIPSSVTSIGQDAFYNCSGLTSVYVSWESPLSINASIFVNANTKSCILYVPKGTYDDYFISNWGVFDNIEEYDVTGIDNVTTSSDVKEISRYSVNGQRLDVPTKGLNIVKYSDGSVKKVVVQ